MKKKRKELRIWLKKTRSECENLIVYETKSNLNVTQSKDGESNKWMNWCDSIDKTWWKSSSLRKVFERNERKTIEFDFKSNEKWIDRSVLEWVSDIKLMNLSDSIEIIWSRKSFQISLEWETNECDRTMRWMNTRTIFINLNTKSQSRLLRWITRRFEKWKDEKTNCLRNWERLNSRFLRLKLN